MKTNAVLAAAAAALIVGAAPAPDTVDYELRPVLSAGELTALQVTVRFRGDADGETLLKLPESWAGENELWRHLRDVKITGGESVTEDGPARRVVRHRPGARLTATYRVVSGFDHDPAPTSGNPHKPIIRPAWFYAYGEALFAEPDGRIDTRATFRWSGAPKGFGFASDLEHLARERPGVVGDVLESIVIGGPALKVYTRDAGGSKLRLAVLGDYAFSHDAFVEMSTRIITAENTFWGGNKDPFLVALAPLKAVEGVKSLGGTGRADAFAMTVVTDSSLDDMRYLLAHEYMHTWNSVRLGGLPDGPQEPSGYWFSEGFTDFYTRRLLLRYGVYSLEDFVADWNETLKAYAASPARTASNARIVEAFWTDYAVQKAPYYRGALLAAAWDYRLAQQSGGKLDMDDVMHAMMARAAADRSAARAEGRARTSADALLPLVYREVGGLDLSADLDRFVTGGEGVLLPTEMFGDCARVETIVRPAFARGWDPEATTNNGNIVTGLKDGSPAYRAGLRNGMKIIKRAFGEVGNSQVEYGLRVDIDGKEQLFRFMPLGEGPDMVLQQIVLAPGMDAAKRAACEKRMSGA